MISRIEIENFRCFRKQSAEKLSRINLVVGKNASGKTALLEAIFLTSMERPDMVLGFKANRGFGERFQVERRREAFEDLWKDLFFLFDQKKVIRISLSDSAQKTRTVVVKYSSEPQELPLQDLRLGLSITPMQFTWMTYDKKEKSVLVSVTPQGELSIDGSAPVSFVCTYITTLHRATIPDAVQSFSALSRRNEEHLVVDVLRKEFPYLLGLSIENYLGQAMVHARVEGLPEKIPLGFVSEGVSRILNILLAITRSRDGVVLVDEVENGIYYLLFPGIWRVLWQFCREHNVQLFATTHSMEALQGMRAIADDHPDDIAVVRTEKLEHECSVRTFRGSEFRSALRVEAEIR